MFPFFGEFPCILFEGQESSMDLRCGAENFRLHPCNEIPEIDRLSHKLP